MLGILRKASLLWRKTSQNNMISDLQKELIAIQVIRTLYKQFEKFPEDVSNNRNAPFHEAFLEAFAQKLENKVESVPVFISLSSWMHGLNTSLGQSFFEKTAHILCGGTKREFTTKKKNSLKTTQIQKSAVADIITDLTNGLIVPNLESENEKLSHQNEVLVKATDFTADVFFEDENEIVCIEFKTVKPNKGVFKVEKQKVLEAKAALKRISPDKNIIFLIGFPFDPLSDTPCGYDKQRFMNYSVDFRKYFAENEFLLSAELWDYLSGTTQTMETILSIINSIATVEFLAEFKFLQNRKNAFNQKSAYLDSLEKWYLQREKQLVENQDELFFKISSDKVLKRTFNQDIFTNAGNYNETRIQRLQQYL